MTVASQKSALPILILSWPNLSWPDVSEPSFKVKTVYGSSIQISLVIKPPRKHKVREQSKAEMRPTGAAEGLACEIGLRP